MALQKDFETDSGFTGNYWRIDRIEISRFDKQMVATLNLYKSSADRTAGKEQMRGVSKTVVMPIVVNDILNYSYTQAKLLDPYFSDAVDV
ncbi:hypothetical protein LCGC14_2693370 [marine sediment metagenome]|uniref:Uncharacterized protein n=1 Tax=marine sediment metagenome TaxID=412755 RepID=A0A0F9BSJ3_9ZZZZ